MSNEEIVAVILILLIYCIFGIMVGCLTRHIINDNGFINYEITSSFKNISFIRRNKILISLIAGSMWLFIISFSVWYNYGGKIYNRFIIKDDEESRIAPWFV